MNFFLNYDIGLLLREALDTDRLRVHLNCWTCILY